MAISSITGTFLGAPVELTVTTTDSTTPTPVPVTPVTPTPTPTPVVPVTPTPTPTPTAPVTPYSPPALVGEVIPPTPALPQLTVGVSGNLAGFVPFGQPYPLNQSIKTNAVSIYNALVMSPFGPNQLRPETIPFTVVDSSITIPETLVFTSYGSQSDAVLYPTEGAAVENGSDQHVLVIDKHTGWIYETFVYAVGISGQQAAACGCIWDAMNGNPRRPVGWTSADAAGLPVLPLIAKYQEAISAAGIQHSLRMTFSHTETDGNGGVFVFPASHSAGDLFGSGNIPAVGFRLRLKPTVSTTGISPVNLAIVTCLQTYGAVIADNGITGLFAIDSDPRWDATDLMALAKFTLNDFEIVNSGPNLTPADFLGAAPVINSFTATKAANGTDVELAFTTTGQTYAYISGEFPVRGGSLPGGGSAVLVGAYKSGAQFTLVANNDYDSVSAVATVA